VNRQRNATARTNARAHYDVGEDLFSAMLGPTMVYSCGYWRAAENLDEAQRAKLELVCAKLELQRGHYVLDVGCGYGELARHAAERYGVHVVGITISAREAEFARRRCGGLPVEIRERGYREVHGRFDRVVSIGMFEHVGSRNYDGFFARMRSLLKPGGLFLLQTVGNSRDSPAFDPWLDRHVSPGATLPSALQITKGIDGKFVLEDWQNFGVDYDRTLLAWHRNFERAWPSLSHYGEAFHRRWRYYLLTSAGAFRARRNQLWQIVMSPDGQLCGYQRPVM
jgi:cyclopropane-fatty-acyl-phospholipid synthase